MRKDTNGDVTFVEFDELGVNDDAAKLAGVMDQLDSLISDEDVEEWAARLDPGNSEAILVFEHTWAKPFRDAVVESGGVLADNIRFRAQWSTNCWPNWPNCPTTDVARTIDITIRHTHRPTTRLRHKEQ